MSKENAVDPVPQNDEAKIDQQVEAILARRNATKSSGGRGQDIDLIRAALRQDQAGKKDVRA